MLDILSNLHFLLVNMVNNAKRKKKKKEHQEAPRANLGVSSMKVKAMDILHHSVSLRLLANYLCNE